MLENSSQETLDIHISCHLFGFRLFASFSYFICRVLWAQCAVSESLKHLLGLNSAYLMLDLFLLQSKKSAHRIFGVSVICECLIQNNVDVIHHLRELKDSSKMLDELKFEPVHSLLDYLTPNEFPISKQQTCFEKQMPWMQSAD